MEGRVTQHRVDRCLETVAAICASPSLAGYVIGFTVLPVAVKADSYRRHGFDHLVALADKMDRATALELEHRLQSAACANRTSVLYRKYHRAKRDKGVLYRSSGGSPRDASIQECSVYMVWWKRPISN